MLRNRAPVTRTWLDELPHDVCDRIVAIIKSFRDYYTIICLSNVSDIQRMAIKSAYDYKLDFIDAQGILAHERKFCCGGEGPFTEIFQEDVQEICATGTQLLVRDILRCFKSSTLTKLVVFQLHHDFDPVLLSQDLRVLELQFRHFEKGKLSLRRLAVLNIQELKLETYKGACLHKRFTDNQEHHHELSVWFPQAEKVTLACGHCGGVEKPRSYLWRAIERFPALKDATITEHVPDDAIEKLMRMRRVSLQEGDVLTLAEKLGERVVRIATSISLSTYFPKRLTMHNGHFERLSACTALEHLTCCVKPGDEIGLVHVVKNLRSLSISFGHSPNHFEPLHRNCTRYQKTISGALLEAIRAAPHLTSISFINMQIERCELREILKVIGQRLENFQELICASRFAGQPYCYSKEDAADMMQELIETLSTVGLYNRSLTSFAIDTRASWFTDKRAVVSLLPRLATSLAVLKRRCPRLDTESLNRLVREFGEIGAKGSILAAESPHVLPTVSTDLNPMHAVLYPSLSDWLDEVPQELDSQARTA